MKCSGCGACSIICPQKCISMEVNERGFLRPTVNELECIHCNLCEKVCFYHNCAPVSLDRARLYSSYIKEKAIRSTSSSGGVAYQIAKTGIADKKLVCGAVFDYSSFTVKHKLCFTTEDIEPLKGSKYLQSNCQEAFSRLVQLIRNDDQLEAIVFGTPCQIAGLNNALNHYNIRNRVLLIDIFCHGVPSLALWKEYLTFLETKNVQNIKKIIFRDKHYSWHSYYMHIFCDNGEYVVSREKDPFLKLFCMGVLNQKECFTCRFRNESAADIRLGDYWGKRYSDSEEGYSMVLTLTEKGKEYFKSVDGLENVNLPIEERLGQQHTDYTIPSEYDKGFKLLLNHQNLCKIINLHDPYIDQIIRRIKAIVKLYVR